MARLIEIQAGQGLPPALAVRVGDLLVFDATGDPWHGPETVPVRATVEEQPPRRLRI